MKLSIESYHLVEKFGYRKAFSLIKAAGFEAVDFSLYYDATHWLLQDDYRERALDIRKALDETGLVCTQTHAPFHSAIAKGLAYGSQWNEDCPEYLETIRAIEVTAILGAPHTVIHNIKVPEGVDLMEYNLAFYQSFLPYLKKFDTQLAIENMQSKDAETGTFQERIGTAQRMNTLFDRLNSDRYVLLVDTGHAILGGTTPEALIRGLTPGSLRGLHVQDTDATADRHQLPFMGTINWEEVLQALKDTGYKGDLTFEIPKILGPLPDALVESCLAYAATVGKYLIKRFREI